jgi:hypothetical protein
MAKFTCRCGKTLSTTVHPNDVVLHLYTDSEFDAITESDGKLEDLPLPKYDVWRCPECKRIYFFEENKAVQTYVLEPETQVKTPGENSP